MSVSSVPSAGAAGRKWRGKRAALLTPAAVVVEPAAEGAGLPGGQDPPAARSAQDAAGMSELELVEPDGLFWPDDELEPGAAPVSAAAARHTSNILPSAGGRLITGIYSAAEVRALPGELVSIEGTIPPGRYRCTWRESEPSEDLRREGHPDR